MSIVTINLNKRSGLRRTLASLSGQTDRDFECIVVDGGSTDGSIDVITEYSDLIDLRIVERDKGIYDAWNKGLARAGGEVIGILNSGDSYDPEVVARAKFCFQEDPSLELIFGYTVIFSDGRLGKRFGNRLHPSLLFGLGVVHPSMFATQELYGRVGNYPPVSIASDTNFILRCVSGNARIGCGQYTVFMEAGGVSATQAVKGFSQYAEALKEHGFCGPYASKALKVAYAGYRKVRRR